MKIGLDYGGVISFAPDGWAGAIKKAISRGHDIYLVSHAVEAEGLQIREDYCQKLGITNLSFGEFDGSSPEVGIRKAELCQQYDIEIFIDDDLHRVEAVGRLCDRCASLYIPQNLWQVGQRLIDGLAEDYK